MTTFSYIADAQPDAPRAPATNNAKFGDGYEQRSEAGINSLPEIWEVSFTNRDLSEANAIDTFFKDRKGVTYFQWTTPTGVSGNFICRSWNYKRVNAILASITAARFEQVFDP